MTTTTAFVTYKRLNLAYRIGGGVVWVLALVALGFYNKETSPALLGLLWAIWGVCSISLIVSLFFSFKSFKQYIENLETEKNALTEKAEQLQALEEETRQTFEQIQQELEAKQQALEIDAQLLQEKTEQINAMEEETRQTFEQIQIAQEILEQSEQALRGRMEAINRTMCVCEFNLDGIIVEANSMMLQILKYTHEELVGKHFKHFIDRNFMESALYELILISLENKIGYSGDIKIVGKESELWFHVTLTPVFSKTKMLERVVLLGNDITINKLKNIEYEARVKSLLQFSPVAEFDLEGNFLRANPLFLAIFDYAKDGMKGKTYLDLVTEDRKETMRELWKNLQTGEFIEGEFLHTNAHGNPIWLRNSYTPIRDLDERPYKIVWLATNITARKNYEIQIQNQNEDIMASIEYAQRIQVAMLPTRESMAAHLSDFFMLYMPKDIVSGDFYWFEVKEDKIFAIAVDCTGHGVPGAFMSMLGNETLHEIIGLRNVYESHEIIKLLHLHIRKALKQHNNQNHEGMDIGVAVIDKTRGVLEFAGAGNTMWLVQEGEIQDVRGNWKGVGGYEIGKTIQYEPNFFTLLPNTVFYLLSDGYIDQFGGAQGKKFGTKRFKAMLQQHYALPMQEQENVFRQAFEDWRAESNDKQVDDIMLWGIKV